MRLEPWQIAFVLDTADGVRVASIGHRYGETRALRAARLMVAIRRGRKAREWAEARR